MPPQDSFTSTDQIATSERGTLQEKDLKRTAQGIVGRIEGYLNGTIPKDLRSALYPSIRLAFDSASSGIRPRFAYLNFTEQPFAERPSTNHQDTLELLSTRYAELCEKLESYGFVMAEENGFKIAVEDIDLAQNTATFRNVGTLSKSERDILINDLELFFSDELHESITDIFDNPSNSHSVDITRARISLSMIEHLSKNIAIFEETRSSRAAQQTSLYQSAISDDLLC